MSIYLLGDTHFFHFNILKYEPCRLKYCSSIEGMNKMLIDNWNSVVKEDDLVWFLGDFGLCRYEVKKEIFNQLNGVKNLIYGNHDRETTVRKWLEMGFAEVYKKPIEWEGFILSHAPQENHPLPNICGHTHSNRANDSKHFCVSVEMIDFKPICFEKIKEYFDSFQDISKR
jgi:calcineurin-like phosphoesterase family protein